MDSKHYEVQPNDNSTSRFLFKIVEIRKYDSGHESKSDVDFFENVHDAVLACEELNQETQ